MKESLLRLFEQATSLPWYAYVAAFIAMMLIFGKKKEWEYEAKLFQGENKGIKGELEIIKFKKADPEGILQGYFLAELYGKEVEIMLNDDVIQKIHIHQDGQRYDILYPRLERKTTDIYRPRQAIRFNVVRLWFDERTTPQNNDKVTIRANNEGMAFGQMLRD